MIQGYTKTIRTAAAFIVAAAITGAASAATINEPFNAPLGGLPDDFTLVSNIGTSPVPQIVNLGTTEQPDNYLRLGRLDSSANNAALYYTAGDDTATSNNQFGDFTGSVILQWNDANSVPNGFGLVLRAQNPTYNYNGYWVVIAPRGVAASKSYPASGYPERGLLIIYKNPTTYSSAGELLATSSPITTSQRLAADTDYKVTFSANGNHLSVSLYGGANFDNLLATVSTDLATDYQSGYFGLRSGSPADTRYGYFKDLSVVPEPASLGLLGIVAGGWLLKRRRK